MRRYDSQGCSSRRRRFGFEADEKDSNTQMPAFKNPGFQERQEAAARAREAALARYQARPPVDTALMAERSARRKARADAEAEKRAAALKAKEDAAAAKREQERQAAEAAEAAAKAKAEAAAQAKADATARKVAERKLWTEDDRKAARDARYAARKLRQARR
jgi:hypothetical protein